MGTGTDPGQGALLSSGRGKHPGDPVGRASCQDSSKDCCHVSVTVPAYRFEPEALLSCRSRSGIEGLHDPRREARTA